VLAAAEESCAAGGERSVRVTLRGRTCQRAPRCQSAVRVRSPRRTLGSADLGSMRRGIKISFIHSYMRRPGAAAAMQTHHENAIRETPHPSHYARQGVHPEISRLCRARQAGSTPHTTPGRVYTLRSAGCVEHARQGVPLSLPAQLTRQARPRSDGTRHRDRPRRRGNWTS
jgi:hypothetical protein